MSRTNDILLDRVPPQALDAEQAALGAMLLEREAIARGVELLAPEDFYREAHRHIFRGILDLYYRNEPVDLITLGRWLEDHGEGGRTAASSDNLLALVGGTLYLTTIMQQVPTAAGIVHYARIVKGKSLQRQLIKTADEILRDAYLGDKELDELLRESEGKLFALTERALDNGPLGMPDVYELGRVALEQRRQADAEGYDVGFKTNLRDLNRVLQPLKPGEMLVVAGRPAMGKSAFCMQLAIGAAEQNVRGLFLSLEMDQDSLAMRLLLSHGFDQWKANNLLYRTAHPDEVYGALETALESYRGLPLRVVDAPALRPNDILHLGRRAKLEGGLDFIVVDYLQLMDANERHQETYERIRAVSRELKQVAKTLKVVVIAVSQLSRQVESRTPPRPMMSDLRECVTGDTRLVDARTGQWVFIRDVQPGDEVLGVSEEQKIVRGAVEKVWSTGVKPVWTITTRTGRTITATQNHPLLTAQGWKKVGELQVGDVIAEADLPDPTQWATSDLLWEEILSIEPAGEQEVWDICVPACSTFLANGIVAHNSGQIEQDADKIILLYRPGYYGKRALQAAELPEDDIASTEVILAKQRNGPTDSVWVRFEPRRTWFYDIDAEEE